jgi:hypothetical protein
MRRCGAMRVLILSVAVALVGALAAVATASAPSELAGTWAGRMSPTGSRMDHGYGFRVTIAADGRSGKWRTNVCGGKLVYLRVHSGVTYFRDRLTFGHGLCKGGGTDRISRVEDDLYVRFSSPYGSAYDSAGTLRRQ